MAMNISRLLCRPLTNIRYAVNRFPISSGSLIPSLTLPTATSIINRSRLSPSFSSSISSLIRSFTTSSSSSSSSSSPPPSGPPHSIVVTLAGPDRRGIVHSLSKRLQEMNANIEESRMTILGNDFAVILLVQLPSSSVTPQHIRDSLQQLFPDFLINTRSTLNNRPIFPTPHRILTLNVHGPDQPGIVRNLTELFVSYNISVRDLDTDSSSAPFAGYKIFNLKAVIAIPTSVNMDKFYEGLRIFEDKYGFEIEFDDPNHSINNDYSQEEELEEFDKQIEQDTNNHHQNNNNNHGGRALEKKFETIKKNEKGRKQK